MLRELFEKYCAYRRSLAPMERVGFHGGVVSAIIAMAEVELGRPIESTLHLVIGSVLLSASTAKPDNQPALDNRGNDLV